MRWNEFFSSDPIRINKVALITNPEDDKSTYLFRHSFFCVIVTSECAVQCFVDFFFNFWSIFVVNVWMLLTIVIKLDFFSKQSKNPTLFMFQANEDSKRSSCSLPSMESRKISWFTNNTKTKTKTKPRKHFKARETVKNNNTIFAARKNVLLAFASWLNFYSIDLVFLTCLIVKMLNIFNSNSINISLEESGNKNRINKEHLINESSHVSAQITRSNIDKFCSNIKIIYSGSTKTNNYLEHQ